MSPTARPFYGRFAWAYDLLVERPVEAECAWIATIVSRRGMASDARVLDAGCGTGRYALPLAARGYQITGVDLSAELIDVARQRPGAAAVRFVVGDLTTSAPGPSYAVVLCRGVLNDLLDDEARDAAFAAFARALQRGGVLLLDVRDWEATVRRRTTEPVHTRTVQTPHGTLAYRSEVRLDHDRQRMLIAERHTLTTEGRATSTDYDFVMRCWTRAELDARLARAGFGAIEYQGAYDPAVPLGATDRIVTVAARA